MKKLVINYLPDIIIIIGIWVLSYNLLRPVAGGPPSPFVTYDHTGSKTFGIVLIALGIDIVVRKYFNAKNEKK